MVRGTHDGDNRIAAAHWRHPGPPSGLEDPQLGRQAGSKLKEAHTTPKAGPKRKFYWSFAFDADATVTVFGLGQGLFDTIYTFGQPGIRQVCTTLGHSRVRNGPECQEPGKMQNKRGIGLEQIILQGPCEMASISRILENIANPFG